MKKEYFELVERIAAFESINNLTDNDKKYIILYSIEKKCSEKEALNKAGIMSPTVKEYYQNNTSVEDLKKIIQERYNRFKGLLNRDPDAFGKQFSSFLEWWYNPGSRNAEKKDDLSAHCYYCGVSESVTNAAFDDSQGHPLMFSEKPSFSGSLQIDKKEPSKGYNKENCVFACVLCNNAKSDMIKSHDFKEIIAPAFKKYWKMIELKVQI